MNDQSQHSKRVYRFKQWTVVTFSGRMKPNAFYDFLNERRRFIPALTVLIEIFFIIANHNKIDALTTATYIATIGIALITMLYLFRTHAIETNIPRQSPEYQAALQRLLRQWVTFLFALLPIGAVLGTMLLVYNDTNAFVYILCMLLLLVVSQPLLQIRNELFKVGKREGEDSRHGS